MFAYKIALGMQYVQVAKSRCVGRDITLNPASFIKIPPFYTGGDIAGDRSGNAVRASREAAADPQGTKELQRPHRPQPHPEGYELSIYVEGSYSRLIDFCLTQL